MSNLMNIPSSLARSLFVAVGLVVAGNVSVSDHNIGPHVTPKAHVFLEAWELPRKGLENAVEKQQFNPVKKWFYKAAVDNIRFIHSFVRICDSSSETSSNCRDFQGVISSKSGAPTDLAHQQGAILSIEEITPDRSEVERRHRNAALLQSVPLSVDAQTPAEDLIRQAGRLATVFNKHNITYDVGIGDDGPTTSNTVTNAILRLIRAHLPNEAPLKSSYDGFRLPGSGHILGWLETEGSLLQPQGQKLPIRTTTSINPPAASSGLILAAQ